MNIRALCYYTLVCDWGAVPVTLSKLETLADVNTANKRDPDKEVNAKKSGGSYFMSVAKAQSIWNERGDKRFDDAAKWVNMIRQRAGLPATNATGTALRDVIYKERQREFAYEFKAWTDIKRGYSPAEIKAIMVADGATMYSDEDLLLPIPHTQYLLNPEGLYQNPGYTD